MPDRVLQVKVEADTEPLGNILFDHRPSSALVRPNSQMKSHLPRSHLVGGSFNNPMLIFLACQAARQD